MELDIFKISGVALSGLALALALLKFQLVTEVAKKLTSDDGLAKKLAMVFVLALVVICAAALSNYTDETSQAAKAEELATEEVEPIDEISGSDTVAIIAAQKSDTEIKIDAIKEGVAATAQLVEEIRENKRKKDSTFLANREERWVYQIGDWMDDEDEVAKTSKELTFINPIKVFKKKKKYLLIKEEILAEDQFRKSLDSLQKELAFRGISIKALDLNTFLSKDGEAIIGEKKEFGRRKNRVTLQCLAVD